MDKKMHKSDAYKVWYRHLYTSLSSDEDDQTSAHDLSWVPFDRYCTS